MSSRRVTRPTSALRTAAALLAVLAAVAPAAAVARTPAPVVSGGLSVGDTVEQQETRLGVLTLTLEEAIGLALRHNRALRGSLIDRAAQKYALFVAEQKFTPDFELGASSGWRQIRPYTDDGGKAQQITTDISPVASLATPLGTSFSARWNDAYSRGHADPSPTYTQDRFRGTSTITITQPLMRGFGFDVNTASVNVARLQEENNILALRADVINMVTSVIDAFRSVLQAQQQVSIAELALRRGEQLLEINRSLIQVGRLAPLEIVQTEASLAQREFDLSTARNQLRAAELSLLSLLNIPEKPRLRVNEALNVQQIRVGFDRALELAMDRRTDVIRSGLAVETARLGVVTAEDRSRWKLDAEASLITGGDELGRYGTAERNRMGMDRSDTFVGLRLSIPFTDESLQLGVINARTQLRRAELEKEAVRDRVELEVRDTLRDLSSRWRQVELARQTLSLAERKLEIERDKLNAGRSTNFQVNQYETDLVNAQTSELQALIAYLGTVARLDRILGTTLQTWDVRIGDEAVTMEPAPPVPTISTPPP